jgi:hypothetical protein
MYFATRKAVFFPRQQKTTTFGGMSPPLSVSQAPRLRAETHFGVQARALPGRLHSRGPQRHGRQGVLELTNPVFSNTMNKPKIRK